ncbi:hypothetical protein [Nitratiruptor sp. SB155-2]|uniref:hypothetical protein n=1 Tax=Nitratiruptor sp. (strain SB155-2) TaxID=387092 RepID=UPI000158721D|nr:hypothetical protein [Nitratiruptor sp. SB155-2]BAF70372.1 conserved hypothetical protein [Nitratiruptor sp. SB155-2]
MKDLLCEYYKNLVQSIQWLEKSFQRCQGIAPDSEENIEKLETFAARFSRSVDILINKFLRSLDLAELESVERRLDSVIRAEKRGFVENYEELIELKNLRNELAHEYLEELFLQKIALVEEYSKKLFQIVQRIDWYMKNSNFCE